MEWEERFSFVHKYHLKLLNLNTAGSSSHIIPIILKDHKKCKKLFNMIRILLKKLSVAIQEN